MPVPKQQKIYVFVHLNDSLLLKINSDQYKLYPIGSMYGIFTYIWLIFMVNVGKYTILWVLI